MEIEYKDTKIFTEEELQRLFLSVNWESGNYPDKLARAMKNSDYVISAWDGDKLMKRMLSHFKHLLYVKVMPSDPATIPYYKRYGFSQYDHYSAMVLKQFS